MTLRVRLRAVGVKPDDDGVGEDLAGAALEAPKQRYLGPGRRLAVEDVIFPHRPEGATDGSAPCA
jgi:hypothetical protein